MNEEEKKDYSVYRTSEEISPLTKWARNNEIPDEMIYKKAAGDQLCFMRDTIPSILSTSYEEYRGIQNSCLEIISSHRSKSIDLPVYKLVFRDFTFVIRDNFYNWKISVNVPYWCRPLDYADFDKLFDPAAIHHEVYCEGFPKHFVHGSFNNYLPKAEESYARREFTIEIHSKYDVYTFFYVLYHRYIKPGKAWYNEKNKDKE